MNEEKNNESEPQKEQEENPMLNKEQYKLLLSCSAKKDVADWNKYREEHPNEKIWLQDADLKDANLYGANLQGAFLEEANLQGAWFAETNLQDVWLAGANLQGAGFNDTNLQHANLANSNLKDAGFWVVNLRNANLAGANLQGADFGVTNLQGARLWRANLKGACLDNDIELQGADFKTAIVDGETLIWGCKVNRYSKSERFTDFEGVGLDSVRIDPETKQLLEYNIRRKNWEEWYKSKSRNKWIIRMHHLATSPIRLFWLISDYGLSTWRIINSFVLLVIIFATIYFVWGWVDYYLFGIKDGPGIVNNLFIAPQAQQQISDVYYCLMIYFRSVCFSVATMFSFGDISVVNTQLGWKWWFSHSIPILQMVTGYMFLGALVTRFAILFTAGGPAGKFAKMNDGI
jgi:uncharacterized protein YjbI with pentapeptide repeats